MATKNYINDANDNFARIAEADGTRILSENDPNSYLPNHGSEPLCDEQGRLIVRLANGGGYGPIPVTPSDPVLNYSNFPNNLVTGGELITNAPGRIYSISGTNTSAISLWLMIFDDFIAPINGTIAMLNYLVGAGQNFSYAPRVPRPTQQGISVAWSTTQNALTLQPAGGTLFVEWAFI